MVEMPIQSVQQSAASANALLQRQFARANDLTDQLEALQNSPSRRSTGPLRGFRYDGLHASEPDSPIHGIWVGPRLDLPTCAVSEGLITIRGNVDLDLLARAGGQDFRLDIHGPCGLLRSATLSHSGPFCVEFTAASDAFTGGSQWSLLASDYVVPKAIGLSQDTRELAWRVTQISVDDVTLIDSSDSHATQPIRQPPQEQSFAPARPSPYGGLQAPEPNSPIQGIWVGPRLDLPTCAVSAGLITIRGNVDLDLLARAGGQDFRLDIHGPYGLLHSASLLHSGPFCVEFTAASDVFTGGSQWTLLASHYVVPKAIGLSQDTRELAWRVTQISVDNLTLIDSNDSPATQPINELIIPGGINLVGYLTAELGLGEAARSLARACGAANIAFSALDVGFQIQTLQRDTSVLDQAVSDRFDIDLLYVNAEETANTVNYLLANNLQARYRIGYWHWEQPQLPVTALSAFAHVDEVWVPSTFVHDAVAPYAPVSVVKVPHAICFSPSADLQRSQFGLPQDKLLVLVMYDFNSYQYRKNPQAALTAFRKAAANRSDAVLVIKTMNGHHHAAERQQLQASVGDLPRIILIDEFFTRQQTWDLQACCDILVSLHRAEGFGLVPAEMMYLGKPVIATNWSANTDFMTADNSMPVRYQLQALQHAVGVYPAGQLWAEADTDHAAWCLTRLLDDAVLRQQTGARAAADIRRQLSPEAVGAQVRQRLSVLGLWHPYLRR